MQLDTLLSKANDLMEAGDDHQASVLIEQALHSSPNDTIYADAVAIYLMGNMYPEALAVFDQYARDTGKDLDKIADYSVKDIKEEQLKYQAAQEVHRRSLTQLRDGQLTFKPVTLRPISPFYVFWMCMFIGLGIYMVYVTIVTKPNIIFVTLLFLFIAGYSAMAGIVGLSTYVRADAGELAVFASRFFHRNGNTKTKMSLLTSRRVYAYAQIQKASIELFSYNYVPGKGLKLHLEDGKVDVINITPFLERDIEKLVLALRAQGVFVFVSPGTLRKEIEHLLDSKK